MLINECEELYSNMFPFWKGLSDDERETICRASSSVKYKKGANIHGGDGSCTGAIIVKTGCARAYLLSEEGREITLYRLYPGNICMLSASCVLEAITFEVFVDAEEDSECIILNGKTFAKLADENIYIKNFALETAVSRFSDVMWVMQQILFMSFDKRLAIFLLDETAKTGGDTVSLTHEQIAKYIGSAREVVSRMLKYFATEGIVAHSRAGIKILDKKRLRELTL